MQKIIKIGQQTFWQGLVKLVTTTSGFLILGIVSRNFGEAGTGDFTLALTYLAFFYIFSDFAFNAHVLHKLDSQEWKKLLGTRIIWSLILMATSLLILLFLPNNFSSEFKLAVLLGSLTILFFALNISAHAMLQSKLAYQYDILPTLLGVTSGTALIFWMANQNLLIYMMVLGYVLAWAIHASGTYFSILKFVKNILPVFDWNYSLRLFKETLPLSGTLILNVLYFRADSFILAYFRTPADVGIYNMAYQIFQAILVLPTFVMNSYYPILLKTLRINKIAFFSLLFLSLSILLTTYFLSPFVIKLITGSGFAGSIESLRILSLGLPAYFLSALLMWVLVAKKKYKSLLMVYGLGLMVNIVANLVFIPQYGFMAASWITGISEYFILLLQMIILLL